ncbi:MAG: Glucose sorbosone dehydrogenase [Nitrosopumilales archaeon]|nr:MAG: Glucose sorbosone dehydrogenase [Nitrosopumilales archaeon]
MDKKLRIVGIIAALAVSVLILSSPYEPPPIPEPNLQESENEFVEILATNLKKPWAIALAGDRIFITEKNGKVRVFESNTLLDEPLATLRTVDVFDGGLLGITVHPDFANNHFLYVYYTYEEDGELWNKILKIKESENKLQDAETILDKIPGSKFSNGGVLKFGPDNKLYVSTGAGLDSSHAAQDLNSLAGKILRLNDDGSFPDDNPFPNSPIFSYGHSNPRGMAWDKNGSLYVSELGPSKNDEINLVRVGQNYGWPIQQCSNGEEFVDAIACYDPRIEPGGIVFYVGDKLDLQNDMIMAVMAPKHLDKLEINENGIISQNSILSGLGRIRDVMEGADGYLYLITSNTDGKGFPDSKDDRLVRILK